MSEPVAKVYTAPSSSSSNGDIPTSDSSLSVLPRYSCLLLSPANFWQNDLNKFILDPSVIKTIYSIRDASSPESTSSLKELLFGLQWSDTGIRRLYLTTRQRTITFAVTMIFSKYDPEFIEHLSSSLYERYPLSSWVEPHSLHDSHDQDGHENIQRTSAKQSSETTPRRFGNITHLYFQDSFQFSDYIPLGIMYLGVFCLVLCFVRKVDLIKNKAGLALGTLLTGIMTFLMALGGCLWFDFNPTLYRIDALPYIASIVGLENMLVLTKCVVSTPVHLDIRVRIAQGLSKEGFSSLKILSFELTLLSLGYFTFVPVIQECCLFGIIGLLSDFFLQLTFFTAILSVDIQRIEIDSKGSHRGLSLSSSSPNLLHQRPTNVFASRPSLPTPVKIPKRVRLAYFWARTRMVHRSLIIAFVLWISFLICNSGFTDHFTSHLQAHLKFSQQFGHYDHHHFSHHHHDASSDKENEHHSGHLPHPIRIDAREVKPLATQHWESLFRSYNISLTQKYISILPPIHLFIPVDPNTAIQSRHESESDPQIFRQFLPQDAEVDGEPPGRKINWTRKEVYILLAFSIPSFCLILYTIYLLYKCCCSRNYAEWRTSWIDKINGILKKEKKKNKRKISKYGDDTMFDAVTVKYGGHFEEIECISSCKDSSFVVSHCISGDVIVWDALSGESHTLIRRSPSYQCPPLQPPVLPHYAHQRNPSTVGTNVPVTSMITPSPLASVTTPSTSSAGYFIPTTQNNDSFSSESTYSSSPSSSSDILEHPTTPSGYGVPHANSFSVSSIGTVQRPSSLNHRRHHSLSSMANLQSSPNVPVRGVPSPAHSSLSASRPYDFSPFVRRMTSSRELLTELVRSAISSRAQSVSSPSATSGFADTTPSSIANAVVDSPLTFKMIWTMEIFGRFVYIGCENGRIEVWDGLSGSLAFMRDKAASDIHATGVTGIRVINTRLIVSFLDGIIEIFHLQPRNGCTPLSSQPYHSTSQSNFSGEHSQQSVSGNNQLYYSLFHVCRAHRQPITALELSGGHILSGSLDHIIKVHAVESGACVYTLHGHYGGITCIEVDPSCPTTAISGCQAGQVCMWDLMTGTCLFSLEAHFGASVASILPTPLYVVTSGTDDRILIWDKYSGHLVHTIYQNHSLCREMVLLSPNILVTARDDHLVLYDISEGRAVRIVDVNEKDNIANGGGHRNHLHDHRRSLIKNIRLSSRAVICDSGLQLCVIHFPGVTEKDD